MMYRSFVVNEVNQLHMKRHILDYGLMERHFSVENHSSMNNIDYEHWLHLIDVVHYRNTTFLVDLVVVVVSNEYVVILKKIIRNWSFIDCATNLIVFVVLIDSFESLLRVDFHFV